MASTRAMTDGVNLPSVNSTPRFEYLALDPTHGSSLSPVGTPDFYVQGGDPGPSTHSASSLTGLQEPAIEGLTKRVAAMECKLMQLTAAVEWQQNLLQQFSNQFTEIKEAAGHTLQTCENAVRKLDKAVSEIPPASYKKLKGRALNAYEAFWAGLHQAAAIGNNAYMLSTEHMHKTWVYRASEPQCDIETFGGYEFHENPDHYRDVLKGYREFVQDARQRGFLIDQCLLGSFIYMKVNGNLVWHPATMQINFRNASTSLALNAALQHG